MMEAWSCLYEEMSRGTPYVIVKTKPDNGDKCEPAGCQYGGE